MLFRKNCSDHVLPEGGYLYCGRCGVLLRISRCPVCGSRNLREPLDDDCCFLAEKETVWAAALSDTLTQNDIPFFTKDRLGSAATMRIGFAAERTAFYVSYSHYQQAVELEREYMSGNE